MKESTGVGIRIGGGKVVPELELAGGKVHGADLACIFGAYSGGSLVVATISPMVRSSLAASTVSGRQAVLRPGNSKAISALVGKGVGLARGGQT